jgi:hypothetical protein
MLDITSLLPNHPLPSPARNPVLLSILHAVGESDVKEDP